MSLMRSLTRAMGALEVAMVAAWKPGTGETERVALAGRDGTFSLNLTGGISASFSPLPCSIKITVVRRSWWTQMAKTLPYFDLAPQVAQKPRNRYCTVNRLEV